MGFRFPLVFLLLVSGLMWCVAADFMALSIDSFKYERTQYNRFHENCFE